jgi:hypothetical protein
MSNRQYGGGYAVDDLDSMGGDEIRSMTTKDLRAMRAEALGDAQRALARLDRVTEYVSYRTAAAAARLREDRNVARVHAACGLIDEVT